MSPSELLAAMEQWVARGFPAVRLRGEVSNLVRAASGHSYFALKDESASIRCVLFKQRAGFATTATWNNGQVVDISARPAIYAARGDLQLIVESVRPAGQGDLHAAFILLREKLKDEGLFDEARKRALPYFARRVALVTSPDTAVLRDMASVMARRAPHVQLLLFPASVQGEIASAELIRAVQQADSHPAVDCIIVARGGGSMEDLAAFNDEGLARAIAACRHPVISAVGHETDFSISDFVADLRAPTPTAAAELCALPRSDWLDHIDATSSALTRALERRVLMVAQALDLLGARLISPTRRIQLDAAALQDRALRMRAALRARHAGARAALWDSTKRLASVRPDLRLKGAGLSQLGYRCLSSARAACATARLQMTSTAARLHALGPMNVLARGYVLATDSSGVLITSSTEIVEGEVLQLTWHDGTRSARIDR
ncbi:MAG TPA: exodeoxyribonuclease VII large subunit [Burkholderiaceae bacterium]|nr:exodeoxyribonuclease VII large subunit [Burkholderiaceae bacterium]